MGKHLLVPLPRFERGTSEFVLAVRVSQILIVTFSVGNRVN
jgi:hypothetical protein